MGGLLLEEWREIIKKRPRLFIYLSGVCNGYHRVCSLSTDFTRNPEQHGFLFHMFTLRAGRA